jgi:hypothetical protein
MISHGLNIRNEKSERTEIVEGLKRWKTAGGSMKVGFPGHRKRFRNVSNLVRNG